MGNHWNYQPEDERMKEVLTCENCEEPLDQCACLWIEFDHEKERHFIDKVFDGGYLPIIDDGNTDWYVAETEEDAGDAAKKYWMELAETDPAEFACLVGNDTLVRWGMNQPAGPGSVKVCNLEEWLELVAEHPEEEFGSYDGNEIQVRAVSESLQEDLGFVPTVAYRHN